MEMAWRTDADGTSGHDPNCQSGVVERITFITLLTVLERRGLDSAAVEE